MWTHNLICDMLWKRNATAMQTTKRQACIPSSRRRYLRSHSTRLLSAWCEGSVFFDPTAVIESMQEWLFSETKCYESILRTKAHAHTTHQTTPPLTYRKLSGYNIAAIAQAIHEISARRLLDLRVDIVHWLGGIAFLENLCMRWGTPGVCAVCARGGVCQIGEMVM